jgi:hypothetical protein
MEIDPIFGWLCPNCVRVEFQEDISLDLPMLNPRAFRARLLELGVAGRAQ